MGTQNDQTFNFVQGDSIQQEGFFHTGVDKSNRSTTYNVGQAGSDGPHSHNIIYDQQVWHQNTSSLQEFLQSLKTKLSQSSLTHESLKQANHQISTIEIQLKSTNPNKNDIKTAGKILYGILLGIGGNLATKLLGLLTGLNL